MTKDPLVICHLLWNYSIEFNKKDKKLPLIIFFSHWWQPTNPWVYRTYQYLADACCQLLSCFIVSLLLTYPSQFSALHKDAMSVTLIIHISPSYYNSFPPFLPHFCFSMNEMKSKLVAISDFLWCISYWNAYCEKKQSVQLRHCNNQTNTIT
jgi:hypothetical protein